MKNKHISAFWVGFLSTVALTAWVYWMWRQKRVVVPEPLVVAGRHRSRAISPVPAPAVERQRSPISDALEEIKGIGPVFANRLNEAGIVTFAQLASSSPDELVRITGVKRWDPEDWIAEAAALATSQ